MNIRKLIYCCIFPALVHSQAFAQTPYVQVVNGGPGELTNCDVPVNVRFARESVYNPILGNYIWVMNRYVQRATDTGFALMRGAIWTMVRVHP